MKQIRLPWLLGALILALFSMGTAYAITSLTIAQLTLTGATATCAGFDGSAHLKSNTNCITSGTAGLKIVQGNIGINVSSCGSAAMNQCGTATVSLSTTFSSATSYSCWATSSLKSSAFDNVLNQSTSSILITVYYNNSGTGSTTTDNTSYVCVGT